MLYYYFVWSPEGKVPLYHAIQRTIDVYSLGRRLEEYRGKFGNYPCVADTPACDWQRELAKVNPSEPLPNDPKTGQSYVYLADESISAVAARMYRAPFTSICLKHGGETIWLVYYGGHKTASLVCGGTTTIPDSQAGLPARQASSPLTCTMHTLYKRVWNELNLALDLGLSLEERSARHPDHQEAAR